MKIREPKTWIHSANFVIYCSLNARSDLSSPGSARARLLHADWYERARIVSDTFCRRAVRDRSDLEGVLYSAMKMSSNHLKWFFPLLIAFAATIAASQTECPTIVVTGPAGIPDEGALIPIYVQIEGKAPSKVTYRWGISSGKIVEGQGTDKAKFDVKWPTGERVTATVEVVGLPEGCANTASETMGVAIDPGPIYVGHSDKPSTYTTRVNELIEVLEKYPDSQGYIYRNTEFGSLPADRTTRSSHRITNRLRPKPTNDQS